jgi:farnesyl diphosphate synthase
MDELLPDPAHSAQSRLAEAMRYSALAPGKRLRPFLTLQTAALFGVSENSSLRVASAIECVHTYSLIHDDLPSMDDDDIRRGQPSSHVKFDEATAILAGDALLSYAFEILADDSTHPSHAVRCELIKAVAKSAGPSGMVAGQMMDMEAEKNHQTMDINEIIRLQNLKTGELFAVSCEAGAILGKASDQLRKALRAYARDIGLAFQITDDILDDDAENNDARLDKSFGKATFVSAMGLKKAKEHAQILADQAICHLKPFGSSADLLCQLAQFIVNRKV